MLQIWICLLAFYDEVVRCQCQLPVTSCSYRILFASLFFSHWIFFVTTTSFTDTNKTNMKFSAFVTSVLIAGSEAFAPGAGNTRSSSGKFDTKTKLEACTFHDILGFVKLEPSFPAFAGHFYAR